MSQSETPAENADQSAVNLPEVSIEELEELADVAGRQFTATGGDGSVVVMDGSMDVVRVEPGNAGDARSLEQSLVAAINDALAQVSSALAQQLDKHIEMVPELGDLIAQEQQAVEESSAAPTGDLIFSGASDDRSVEADVDRATGTLVSLRLRDTEPGTIEQIPTAVNRAINAAMTLNENSTPLAEMATAELSELQRTLGEVNTRLDEVEARLRGWENR